MEASTVEGTAYVRAKTGEEFVQPCDAYLKAVSKTLYSYKKGMAGPMDFVSPEISFDVINRTTRELENVHNYTLTNEDLNNL